MRGSVKTIISIFIMLISVTYSIQAQFAGGTGTVADPYQITTVAEFNNVRNFLDAHYILKNDLDFNIVPYNSGEGWVPIGTYHIQFKGSLDGNGKVIKNLFIDKPDAK